MEDPARIRVPIRATRRLASGRQIARIVKRDAAQRAPAGDPRDEERRAIVLREFLDELQDAGHALPAGRGVLVAVLGAMAD